MKNQYLKHFVVSMAVFVLLLILMLVGFIVMLSVQPELRKTIVDTPLRYFIILTLAVPFFFALNSFSRSVGELDELQRRIQFEGFAFSLGGTAMFGLVYGLLEYAGMPHLNWFFVLPLSVFLWVLGVALARRRYDA